MKSFMEKAKQSWMQQNSLLTLGLDPNPAYFPAHLRTNTSNAIYEFCRQMVDVCAEYTCAFKPQIAYFSSASAEAQLEKLCAYIKQQYPNHLLILDTKRGDIGSTAEHYAKEAFERYQADAVTINPYMGFDSVAPFLEWKEKGVFILCRTSNPGGSAIQSLKLENGKPLYMHLAQLIAEKWNKNEQCGLVVGDRLLTEINKIRQGVRDMPQLSPGISAQGVDIRQTVTAGKYLHNQGMFINSARAILYASQTKDWLQAARMVAKNTQKYMSKALQMK